MKKLQTVRAAGPWLITDSGVNSAARNMAIDQKALDAMVRGIHKTPIVRLFQWQDTVVTYGYLLDKAKVKDWATANGNLEMVQRPTGGGAVVHAPTDLAISFLWPRKSGLLPDNPRDCYAEIHAMLRAGVKKYLGDSAPSLYAPGAPGAAACDAPPADGQNRFSVCFEAPVCNDVMLGDRKVVGGALRITRTALLYQGAVQLRRTMHLEKLKSCLLSAIMEGLAADKVA